LASFFGNAGYTLSLLFYSPLVVSNASLVEPLLAETLGFVLGLDALPGLLTLIGTVFAIYGIVQIERGSRERLENQDEKDRAEEAGLELAIRGAKSPFNLSRVSKGSRDSSIIDDSQ